MEGNYKKWKDRINSKQDVLTEDNVGEFMDLELSTKSAPTSGDTVLAMDSVTGKAVEIPTSSLGGNVKSDSYKFTLPTALTPTPNTLIPKTDGSGLLWYNNSSTPADLGFKTKVISINSDTVLSEVHNNNIILITAKCTITIPSGLSQDFNCVFMVKGAFTATFIQGSGATIYAPNGLLLKTDSKASFFYESSNNYILTGELTTS